MSDDQQSLFSRSATTFKLKERVRVSELWISDCIDDISEATHTPENAFVLGWPTTNFVVSFADSQAKDLWKAKLKEWVEPWLWSLIPEMKTLIELISVFAKNIWLFESRDEERDW